MKVTYLHIPNSCKNTEIPLRSVLKISSFGFFMVLQKFYCTQKIISFIEGL